MGVCERPLDVLDRVPLASTVEAVPAREHVGRRQAALREARPVRPAAHRLELHLDPHPARRLERDRDGARVDGVDVGLHVAVALGDLHRDAGAGEGGLGSLGGLSHEAALALEACLGEVAEQDPERRALGLAGERVRVEVADLALGRLRRLAARQQRHDLRCDADRVDEDALGVAWVDAHALDRHHGLGSVERLGVEAVHARAVERVRDVGTEALEVHRVRAAADLLVGREQQPQRRASGGRAGCIGREEVGGELHDDGDAGLVVASEQRRAVAREQVVAGVRAEVGVGLGVEHDRRIAGGRERPAVPRGVDERAHVLARRIRARIDVRAERHDRSIRRRARDGRVDDAGVVHLGVGHPDLVQLADEHPAQVELPVRRRRGARGGVRGRVDLGVAAEAPRDRRQVGVGSRDAGEWGRGHGGGRRTEERTRQDLYQIARIVAHESRRGCTRSLSATAAPRSRATVQSLRRAPADRPASFAPPRRRRRSADARAATDARPDSTPGCTTAAAAAPRSPAPRPHGRCAPARCRARSR